MHHYMIISLYHYINIPVFAQFEAWRVNLACRIVVRLNRVDHRITAMACSKSACSPIQGIVTAGATFLAAINSAIASAGERRRRTAIHINNVIQAILECPPNNDDAQGAYFSLKYNVVYSQTDCKSIIDAIADVMRPKALSVRRDPALLGWSRPHEQYQSCENFCMYFTEGRWALIKDPQVSMDKLFNIFAGQAFDIGLRKPLNATFVRMLAIACASGRPIPRDAFWDRMRALKQTFYAWGCTRPHTMHYVKVYPCNAKSFAELYPDCYPGSECPMDCPLSAVDMLKFVQAMPIRKIYGSSTSIGPQSTIDGCAPPTGSAPPLVGVTPQRSSSDIPHKTPGSLPDAASSWRSESEILRETQCNGNGSVPNGDRACSRKSVVPSPPVARTDVDDGPPTRASGTSSAPSLEDDLAMTLDHVKQEDPTETRAAATATPASSARDVSCMARAVGDHRDKRPREHSLDPADYRVRKSLALPVNPTIDPPFPGTEWHPPISFCTVTIHMDVSQGRWVVRPAWPYTKKTFGWRTDPVRTWAAVIAFAKNPHFD